MMRIIRPFDVGDRVEMIDPSTRLEEEYGYGMVGTVTKIEPIVQTDTYSEYILWVDFDGCPELSDKPQFHWRFDHEKV